MSIALSSRILIYCRHLIADVEKKNVAQEWWRCFVHSVCTATSTRSRGRWIDVCGMWCACVIEIDSKYTHWLLHSILIIQLSHVVHIDGTRVWFISGTRASESAITFNFLSLDNDADEVFDFRLVCAHHAPRAYTLSTAADIDRMCCDAIVYWIVSFNWWKEVCWMISQTLSVFFYERTTALFANQFRTLPNDKWNNNKKLCILFIESSANDFDLKFGVWLASMTFRPIFTVT